MNLLDKSDKNPLWKVIEEWWEQLEHNKGVRAELRKATTPYEVFLTSAFQRSFIPTLHKAGIHVSVSSAEKLALPVGVLSHVKTLCKNHTASLLAVTEKDKEKAAYMRFRKLLSATDRDAAYVALVRMVKHYGRQAEIKSLIRGGYWWNEITHREWAREYYAPNYNHEK